MNSPRILITSGSGFLGRYFLEELLKSDTTIRALQHDSSIDTPPVEIFKGGLEDPALLDRACEGIDVLVHLATYIGEDAGRCEMVNARGTETLVDIAVSAGVKRILYVSSAGIYGKAIHRDADESEVVAAPYTPISRSRLAAEEAVLDAGGIVIRPLFVYGRGDTRFIPTIIRSVRRLPFIVRGGRARISVITAEDLSRTACALALTPQFSPGIYHANDGCPVRFAEIIQELAALLGTLVPRISLPYKAALMALRLSSPGLLGSRRWSDSTAHRLFLVSYDHFYDSGRLWKETGLSPGPPIIERLKDYYEWYWSF